MNKFVAEQEVEVYYEGNAGVNIWLRAKIVSAHVDHYRVQYYDRIPNFKDSLCTIPRDNNIAARLRPFKNQQPHPQPKAPKLETSRFKIGDMLSYKCKSKWIDAKVFYVAATSKFIKIEYMNNGYKQAQINECEYGKYIRIEVANELDNSSLKCKDNKDNDIESQGSHNAEVGQVKTENDTDGTDEANGADGNESDDVGLDSAPPGSVSTAAVTTVQDMQVNEAPSTTDAAIAIDSKSAASNNDRPGGIPAQSSDNKSGDKSSNISGDGDSWIFKVPGVSTLASMMVSNSKPDKAAKPKKKRTWDQKAISDWSHKDVISWIKSLNSCHKYSPDNFPDHFDGNELLKTEEGDLTLIIKSTMSRKLFIKHLAKAKVAYATAAGLNEEEYEDDDFKIASSRGRSSSNNGSVIGIVGLRNQGNTCYMNTSIQILSQSPYITEYLAKRAKLKNHGSYPMLNGWTELCGIIYNQSSRSSRYTYKPVAIRNALTDAHQDFGSGAQDDSARSLQYMLQELDKEIDAENNQTDIESRTGIELQPGPALSESEIGKYVSRLTDEHNPPQISSVLKDTFDGIKHETCECLECNQVYQTFSVFRVIDLPVNSNRVTLSNIHVVCNDKYYSDPKFPEISALGHCSVDVLRYHATQYLAQIMTKEISDYHCDIICVSANGKIIDISNDRISDLKNMTGSILVLIDTKKATKKKRNYMLQVCLGVNKHGNGGKMLATEAGPCIGYKKYDQGSMYKLVQQEIASYKQSLDSDEKCDYYINYNNNIFSMEELKEYGVDKSMHNDGINKLLFLRVNPKINQCSYSIKNINKKLLGEAEYENSSCSQLQALTKYKNKKIQIKKIHQKKGRYQGIKEQVDAELAAIEQSIAVFKSRQYIQDLTSKFLSSKTRFTTSSHGLLRSLTECIEEYQMPQVLDETAHAHPCPCKGGLMNSDWVKYQKRIVYSPPIFLFHLDRYGKNMTDNYTSSRSSNSNRGYGGYWNNYGGNKYSHGISYNMKLECDARYNLYGVSNHSGSTQGGHYTATVHCLSNKRWYDVSDSSVNNAYGSATSHSQSATILAYVRPQEQD